MHTDPGCGSVLLWDCDKLCTFSSVDEMFSHNELYGA